MTALSAPVPLEKDVQRKVVALLKACGFRVWSLSQGFRPGGPRHGSTRQSLGLADLYAIPPQPSRIDGGFARPVWFEIKRPGGKPSEDQLAFQAANATAGTDVVIGGVPEVIEYLHRIGYHLGEHAQ